MYIHAYQQDQHTYLADAPDLAAAGGEAMEAEKVLGGERRLAHHLAHLCICMCAFWLVGWQRLVFGGVVNDVYTCACFAWWWVEMKVGGLGSNRTHTHTCVCVYIHTVMKKGETRKGATSE